MRSLTRFQGILVAVFLGIGVLFHPLPPACSQEPEDAQLFMTGFNAYQNKDYKTTIRNMTEVLEKYPDTALRDLTLFWLAHAHFKNGNGKQAVKYLSRLYREFPDSPLQALIDSELQALAHPGEKDGK